MTVWQETAGMISRFVRLCGYVWLVDCRKPGVSRFMKLLVFFRYLWAFPNTALGLLLLFPALLSGGKARVVDGVLEISGGVVAWMLARLPFTGPVEAMTLGHVVLGENDTILEVSRRHERVHVRQYERWGPMFIPVYLLSSFIAGAKGKNRYFANRFEMEAFDEERESV